MISTKTRRFYLGGCRSGKSRLAEEWVREQAIRPTFIATMQPGDDLEMEARVALHRQSRGEGWHLVEEPAEIVAVLMANEFNSDVILIDCLTLWLTNLLLIDRSDDEIEHRVAQLCQAIQDCSASVVLVANEVGLGIVPENSLSRRFRDLAGWINQQVAASCDTVLFVAAGMPLVLKGDD